MKIPDAKAAVSQSVKSCKKITGMASEESLTDQISSASQLTAAKVLDVIALLPGCWSCKRRRIFLHPSQNERCSNTNETFLSLNVWIFFGDVYHGTSGHNDWQSIEEPVLLLASTLYGPPSFLEGLLLERQFENVFTTIWIVKSTNVGMSVRSSLARIVLIRVRGTTSKWEEKNNKWT